MRLKLIYNIFLYDFNIQIFIIYLFFKILVIKPRLAKIDIFFVGKYDTTHLKEETDKYDEVYRNYIKSRGLNAKDTN